MGQETGIWEILHLVALILFLIGSVAFFIGDGVRGLLGLGGGELLQRFAGVNFVIIGILMIAILLTGFREGERWAWYAMWVWPLWATLMILLPTIAASLGYTPADYTSSDTTFAQHLREVRSVQFAFLVLSLVALAISYPKFFRG